MAKGRDWEIGKGDDFTSVELLDQAIKDHPDAYRRFEAKTKSYIEWRVRFYGSDIAEADLPDLTNEVYERFFRYVLSGTFIPVHDGQIIACLHTMARRVVYDYINKRNRREEAEAGFVALQQADDSYAEVDNKIDRENLACDTLHCQMIELRKDGKTYKEIATTLGLKLHQVTAFFYRLRKKLKNW